VFKQRRLADAGLADQVEVREPIVLLNSNAATIIARIQSAEKRG